MPPLQEETSWMSRMSKILIKLSPATSDKQFTQIGFRILSVKTLLFCIGYFGPMIASMIMMHIMGISGKVAEQYMKGNIMEMLSNSASMGSTIFLEFFPFVFASGLPSISSLATDLELPWPKYGTQILVGGILLIASVSVGK